MIRPPLARLDHRAAGGAGQEERRLEVDVVLEVPVVLGHLVERAAAAEHRGEVRQDVDAAQLVLRALDEWRVRTQVAQIGHHPGVPGPLQAADQVVQATLVQVDGHHLGPGAGEPAGDGRADAPGGPGHDDAAALEPGADAPRHLVPPRAPDLGAQHLLAAIAVDDLLDDLDAEARLRRRVEPAVDVLDRLGHQLVLHGVAQRLDLDELEGRRAEAHRKAGGGDDRGRPAVGVRLAAVELDPFDGALEAGDALGPPGVDADDIDGAGREDPLEAIDVPFLLAVGDQAGRLRAQVGVALRVPGAERLLDPVQVVLVERLDAAGRRS